MSPEPATSPLSRRKLQLAAVAIGLVAIAILVEGAFARYSLASHLSVRAEELAVPTVAVLAPGKATATATLELPGRIEAYSRAPIYARVGGYLKSWSADIGTPVKAGQLLAEIETPDLDQQLMQARAELAAAKASAALSASTAKRWQALLASDSVSRQEAEEKSGDLANKRAAVDALQANVERYLALKGYARIVAPFDGVVTARSTDVGALINAGGAPGSELFVVSDLKKLRVYVSVPQSYAALVRRGTKARLSVPESPDKSYVATVQSLSQAIASASGSMLVQLATDNADAQLLPGGFANVKLELTHAAGALSIPPSALIFSKTGLRVATVGVDNKAVLKTVTVARDLGSVIEIGSGLAADDRVIESPPDGLADGDPVKLVAAPQAPEQAGRGR